MPESDARSVAARQTRECSRVGDRDGEGQERGMEAGATGETWRPLHSAVCTPLEWRVKHAL